VPRRGHVAGWMLLLAALAAMPAAPAAITEAALARDEPWDPPRVVPLEPGTLLPSPQELEARGARIGEILVAVHDIFDTADPREAGWLYRTANSLHIMTRPRTVRDQLTFRAGQPLVAQRLEESERILRNRRYLFDAVVRVARYDEAANVADIEVSVRDVWTLNPGISYSNRGGRSVNGFSLEELNLLGRGEKLQVDYDDDVDRSSMAVEWDDPNLAGSRWRLNLIYADLSDGETRYVNLDRPFYSFDTRHSMGITASDDRRIQTRYDLGEPFDEFRLDRRLLDLRYGWSKGLQGGWVRRWLVGARHEEQAFAVVPGRVAPAELPADQRFVYPWVGIQWVEDAFATTRNRDQIGRREDLYLGTSLFATLGYSASALGASDDAWLFNASLLSAREYAANRQWRLSTLGSGRYSGGRLEDAVLSAEARHYWRLNRHHALFAAVKGTVTEDLDPDRQLLLGAEEGLRGYPLRYQTGTSSALITLEHRLYTDWYPFRLFNVGAAVFLDSGRTWGSTLGGQPSRGWLSNVGVGLRLGNSRSGLGSVVHVDFSYALDAVPGEDRFQITVETRQGY
jgi:hypothetical protein